MTWAWVGQATKVSAADVNGDASLDLITVVANDVVVLLGDGNRSFSESSRFDLAASPENQSTAQLDLAELNGDDHLDLVVPLRPYQIEGGGRSGHSCILWRRRRNIR